MQDQRQNYIRRVESYRRGTHDWRMFYKEGSRRISPVHHISYMENNLVRMIVEIPRGEQAKLEMATNEPYNPIKQDSKDGKLRFVAFPYPFNYGAIPQTFEDPNFIDPDTGARGDGDPIDAVEIGSRNKQIGEIIECKVLGIWAMIDDGETDWKVIMIDVTDPKADRVNSLDDVDREFPGILDYHYNFLLNYKVPSGKPQNKFAFEGFPQDARKAMQVIEETHQQWKEAIESETQKDIWVPNSTPEEGQSNDCIIA